MVLLVCPDSGWFGSSVVARIGYQQAPVKFHLRTPVLPRDAPHVALKTPVGFASRQDVGHKDRPLPVVDDVKHPPVAHAEPPAPVRVVLQRDRIWWARLLRECDDAPLDVAADRVGDTVEPTLRRLSDGDRVGHARLQSSARDLPGDHALPASADTRQRPFLRPDVGLLLVQKVGAGLNSDVELLPTTAGAEKASADRADDFVARPVEHGSRLVEVQEPTRAERALGGPPTRQVALNGERGAGGALPPNANPGSRMRHSVSSLTRVGANFAQGPDHEIFIKTLRSNTHELRNREDFFVAQR